MDTDNFPLRDPTYLFDAPQFKEKGAIFWPDYWSPGNTIFNVWNTSLVWELTGLDFVNMFEQESGQVLIDRKRHFAALDILAFYSRPDNIMYRYGPVYGDKDLFRLAWMRAGHSFHMIEHPPGWAGRLKSPYGFCGLTMVQYGPEGDVLFLHRNGYKVDSSDKSKRPVWDAIVQWVGYEGKGYWAHTWVARKRWGFPVSPCYGPQHEDPGYERTAGKLLDAVKELEKHILTFASEANLL